MSVLNRSLFAKSYAQGGLVEESDDTPTAKGYLQSKGIPVTPASLAHANELWGRAQGYADGGYIEKNKINKIYDYTGTGTAREQYESQLSPQQSELYSIAKDPQTSEAEAIGIMKALKQELNPVDYRPAEKSQKTNVVRDQYEYTPVSPSDIKGDSTTGEAINSIVDTISGTPDRWLDAITDPGSMFEMPESIEETRQAIEDKTRDYYGLEPSKTASVKDTPPSIPSAVTAKPADPIKTVADEINQISTGKSNGKPASKQSGPAMPDFSVSREETMNLRDFADKIGVDLSDPYDAWAYIRDMSAGLLASNDNTFLGALGDAALLSNKNRSTMEAAQKELKAKLAIAKWKNDEEWAKLKYKEKMALKALDDKAKNEGWSRGSLLTGISDEDTGVEYNVYSPGKNAQLVPEEFRHYFSDGSWGVRETKNDNFARTSERTKVIRTATREMETDYFSHPEVMRGYINDQLLRTSHGGDAVLKLVRDDKYDNIIESLRSAAEEGADQFVDLLQSGDADAASIGDALTKLPIIRKQLAELFSEGIASNYVDADYAAITNEIRKRTNAAIKGIGESRNNAVIRGPEIFNHATESTTRDILFGETEHQKRYPFKGITSGQLRKTEDELADTRGEGVFNFAETPPHYKQNIRTGGTMYNKPNETGFANIDQMGLLEETDFQRVEIDMTNIANILQRNGVDEDKAYEDVKVSYADSRLVFGGDDSPGPTNDFSKYKTPSSWYLEPEYYSIDGKRYKTADLREAHGIFWNGFKGEHYTFENDGQDRIEIKINNMYDMEKPKQISLR